MSCNDSLGAFLRSSPPKTAPTTPTCQKDMLGASLAIGFRPMPQRLPTSGNDLLGAFLQFSHPLKWHQQPQCVISTHWGLPYTFDPGHNDPNKSLRLVGGFPSISTHNNVTNIPNES